jgi:hypothetical protein
MPAKESPKVSPVDRVRDSYKQLTLASRGLNTASDELKEAISVLDAALERLNLGVAAWVELSAGEDGYGSWWCREIGYTRIRDTWCIALRTRGGDYRDPENDNVEEWPFAEAPRWMRIEAVSKIPDLLDSLLKQTVDATAKLKKRTGQVLDLGEAMSAALDEVASTENAGDTNA